MGRFGIGGNAYADFFSPRAPLSSPHSILVIPAIPPLCHPRVGGDLLLKKAAPCHCEGRTVPKQSIQVDDALKKCIFSE